MIDPVVVVGAGHAAARLAINLRQGGHVGRILLVGDEPFAPYDRTALSKRTIVDASAPSRLLLYPEGSWEANGIELMTATPVRRVDPRNRRILLEHGGEVGYGVLVLATGARARRPALPGIALRGVHSLRTLHDAVRLRTTLAEARRVVVIGAGQVGLEAAAALRGAGREVTVAEAAGRLMPRVPSPAMSDFLERLHREHGVGVRLGSRVVGILGKARAQGVALADGTMLMADLVLVAAGGDPNQELATAAGVACNDGIVVDEWLRTGAPDVYAIGDCARFRSVRYGDAVRVESVQNAIEQADAAVAAILGAPRAYDPVPCFRSEQHGVTVEIAGLAAEGDDALVVGNPGAGHFSIEYRRQGRLVAVDAVDDPDTHRRARARIAEETGLDRVARRASGAA